MFRGPETSVVMTDHYPLTFFLQATMLEGIYARWACELRLLNLTIKYIPSPGNKVADALSRTIPHDLKTDRRHPDFTEYGATVNSDEAAWQTALLNTTTAGDIYWQYDDTLSSGQTSNDGYTIYYGTADCSTLVSLKVSRAH